jgi:hypothetical protein
MSGPSNAQTDVVWPGYVAAMASLLLSLLLVAAILVFTISQIGGVIEGYEKAIKDTGFESREQVDEIAKSVGLDDSLPEVAQAGKVNERSIAEMRSLTARQLADLERERPPLDFSRANFDPEAARAAAKLAAEDAEVLRQIDLTQVDVSKIVFTGLDLSKIDLARAISAADMKKIDFSKVDFGLVAKGRIEALKPFIAKEAVRFQVQQLQWQATQKRVDPRLRGDDGTRSSFPPPPSFPLRRESIPAPAPAAMPEPPKPEPPKLPPDRLQVTYVDEVNTLPASQKQQLLQALDGLQRQGMSVRVWVNLPTDDVYLKRTAYARLVSLKAMALEAGFTPSRVQIDIDTVPGMAAPQSEMTFYLGRLNK